MGIYVNTSHNLKKIDSALRWGIVQNSPIDATTSVFDLLGGYPAGRMRPDGEARDTNFRPEAAGYGLLGKQLEQIMRIISHKCSTSDITQMIMH